MNKILKKIRKNIVVLLALPMVGVSGGLLTSCGDYLEVIPENNLAQAYFWQSKADVKSALAAGYQFFWQTAKVGEVNGTSYLLAWGEDRAGLITSKNSSNYNKFNIKATDKKAEKWDILYKVISQANFVLKNAESVMANDQTYTKEELNSHLCEAYFLRSLAYFYIVRNWRDAPLILVPYEDDGVDYNIPKSTDAEILAQIKSDLKTAIDLGAAKAEWDTTWETKGKATCWSIYALMADVCLWNHDYQEAIQYADMIINDKTGKAPQLITEKTHSAWFNMFAIGNQKESIFEVQAQNTKEGNQLLGIYGIFDPNSDLYYSIPKDSKLGDDMWNDYKEAQINANHDMVYEAYLSRHMKGNFDGGQTTAKTIWKYLGGNVLASQPRTVLDNNFIIYRMTDVLLAKAEALLMKDGGRNAEDNAAAIALVNQIRSRAYLTAQIVPASSEPVLEILDMIYAERFHEHIAEGKAWYDFLRLLRYSQYYNNSSWRNTFIDKICEYSPANSKNIRTALLAANGNKWYLPINNDEIKKNSKLVQNPAY